ncbi:FkbM family methyltransferase [Candidatus Laterigemmans baculatus]|uniref:FkbM family methyltransferase n=1 Tax=Candidatus Laterigemmans baculatus TaxID=2770505 RepID=UPI0013DBC1C2|nr:FkbM family methyltransferase [Candidatus Laterigemmans baculatus]
MLQPILKYLRRKADPIELLSRVAPASTSLTSIVHIGAHLAQERHHYEQHGFRKILWVEGSATVYEELRKLLAQHEGPATHSARCAMLTNEDDQEVELRTYSNNGMSNSIFPPSQQLAARWPDVKETGATQRSKSVTLDSFLATTEFADQCDVLVVDVQGAELLVLQGGLKTLSRVKAVVCEVSTVPYYEGGVLFEELNAFLTAQGFVAVSTPRRHGDMLFLRKDLMRAAA